MENQMIFEFLVHIVNDSMFWFGFSFGSLVILLVGEKVNKMNKEKTQLELELLAQVKLLEAEKAFLENQLNNAIAKIAILQMNNG
jgi:hypothetical protein